MSLTLSPGAMLSVTRVSKQLTQSPLAAPSSRKISVYMCQGGRLTAYFPHMCVHTYTFAPCWQTSWSILSLCIDSLHLSTLDIFSGLQKAFREMGMVGLHLWAGEESMMGFFFCLKWECPIVLKTSQKNQPWPHMTKINQSWPHLKTRQWTSRKWEHRQWIKLSNKICPVSLGLGFMSSCV